MKVGNKGDAGSKPYWWYSYGSDEMEGRMGVLCWKAEGHSWLSLLKKRLLQL